VTKRFLQLLYQRLAAIQIREQVFRLFTPEHSAMLHTRTRDALHLGEVRSLLFQPLQDQIDGFEEKGGGREDLALGRVGKNALLDAIFGEVGIEVDLGLVDEFEV
jgi:hypothetical protein